MGATANVHISDDEHTVVNFEMGYQLHDFFASVRPAPGSRTPEMCLRCAILVYRSSFPASARGYRRGRCIRELMIDWRAYV